MMSLSVASLYNNAAADSTEEEEQKGGGSGIKGAKHLTISDVAERAPIVMKNAFFLTTDKNN